MYCSPWGFAEATTRTEKLASQPERISDAPGWIEKAFGSDKNEDNDSRQPSVPVSCIERSWLWASGEHGSSSPPLPQFLIAVRILHGFYRQLCTSILQKRTEHSWTAQRCDMPLPLPLLCAQIFQGLIQRLAPALVSVGQVYAFIE